MRPTGPVFPIFALIAAAALPAATVPVHAQPIEANPNLGGYVPAPSAPAPEPVRYDAPESYQGGDADMPAHGSGLPYFAGLRGSFAFRNSAGPYTRTTPVNRVKANYDVGGGGSLYYGIRLPFGLRAELEGLYRYQPLRNLTINGAAKAGAHGRAEMAAPMINLLWELPFSDAVPVQPFVGVGAGAAYTLTDINDGTSSYLKNDGWNLAYSFMAGANVPLSQSSRFTAMYRWMRVNDIKYGCGTGGILSSCYKTNLTSQGIDLGLEMDL